MKMNLDTSISPASPVSSTSCCQLHQSMTGSPDIVHYAFTRESTAIYYRSANISNSTVYCYIEINDYTCSLYRSILNKRLFTA